MTNSFSGDQGRRIHMRKPKSERMLPTELKARQHFIIFRDLYAIAGEPHHYTKMIRDATHTMN